MDDLLARTGLNLIGCIWSVQQEEGSHNTITVEFYDREQFRDFHFTDPYLYDKACLSKFLLCSMSSFVNSLTSRPDDKGALFSCQPSRGSPAIVFYRPHETWTIRTDWHTQLPEGESITAIALSESYIVVSTSADYVRIYTLCGTPYRVYRQKSKSVTCAAWRDYVMTVGNGAIRGDGVTTLNYSIENVKTDEICQNEDVVALPKDVDLQSVLFSDNGVSLFIFIYIYFFFSCVSSFLMNIIKTPMLIYTLQGPLYIRLKGCAPRASTLANVGPCPLGTASRYKTPGTSCRWTTGRALLARRSDREFVLLHNPEIRRPISLLPASTTE